LYTDFAEILSAANRNPGKVIVPAANNPEALEAVGQAMTAGILSGGIFIGEPKAIEEEAKEVRLDLSPFEIVEAPDIPTAATMAVEFIKEKKGDMLLKGALMTAEYLKPVLKREMDMVPEGCLLSHVSLMQIQTYHKLIIMTDAGVNIAPTVEEKKKMTMNAVRVMQKLGIEKQKVALVAAIEKVNPKMQSTVDAAQVRDELMDEYPDDLYAEGPYDVLIAVSKHAAEEKGVVGNVCGDADILLFHEINGANAVYKIFTAFMPDYLNAAIVTGAKIPLILPSRADPVSTKLLSIALSAVLTGSPMDGCQK
jgi:phosphate butyryltransferase